MTLHREHSTATDAMNCPYRVLQGIPVTANIHASQSHIHTSSHTLLDINTLLWPDGWELKSGLYQQ